MADGDLIPDATAKPDATGDGQKAVLAQLEALKTELAATKAMQSASDKKVAELLAERQKVAESKQTDADRIAALEKKATDAEHEAARERFLSAGYKLAAERGLKSSIVDKFSGNVEELAIYLDGIKAEIDNARIEEANKVMASGSFKPGSGQTTKVDPKKMSPAEAREYYLAEAEKRMSGK